MNIKVDKALSRPVVVLNLQVSDYMFLIIIYMVFTAFTNVAYAFLSLIITACFLLYVNSKGKPDYLITMIVWLKTPKHFTLFRKTPQAPFFRKEDR